MNLPEANAALSRNYLLLAVAFDPDATVEARTSAMRSFVERTTEAAPECSAPDAPR